MPLPKPNTGESQDEFVSRCMSDETAMADFPDHDQRVAACSSQWREVHGGEAPKSRKATDLGMKVMGPLQVTDDAKGEVSAVVATLDVADHGKEVILRDAFESGASVTLSSYSHSTIMAQIFGTRVPTEPPVGKGRVFVEGDKAIFRGKYFMSTERGREAFATTKEMGADQQWSLGFKYLKREPADDEWKAKGANVLLVKIQPLEVSPVTLGEGIGTRTLSAKCDGCGGEKCECAEKEAKVKAEADAAEGAAEEAKAKEAEEAADAEAAMKARQAEIQREVERFQRNMRKFGT